MPSYSKQALEAISKGEVNENPATAQGQTSKELAVQAAEIFEGMERMRSSSDESDVETDNERDIYESLVPHCAWMLASIMRQ